MSTTHRDLIAPKLLVTAILFELVGCGARVDISGATDTSTQTSVTSGVSTGAADTGVNTATMAGTGYNTGVGTGVNTGVNWGTGGAHSIITATGGAHSITNTATGGAKAIDTGVVTSTGTGTSTGPITACYGLRVPPASGTLSVTNEYVTTASLKGYGFTWAGSLNNSSTCITPTCGVMGCTPAFGSTALCAAGVVGADTSYNSAVGVGFNLNQDSTGSVNGTVAAPASLTIVSTTFGAGVGNAAIRVQITDTGASTSWCVEAGRWTSGVPIPITSFNTACWDNSGTYLPAGAPIQAVHLVVPSEATQPRPFAFCLAGVTFS